MRAAILTGMVLLMSTGYALAGPGAGDPKEPADPASGRPGAVLDDAKCADVWSLTQREGDVLSEGQAAPFVVNFKLVDVDGDGKITEAEFKDGCKNGLVQEAANQQQPSGKTAPPSTQGGEAMPSQPQ
jgi:EF hand domain-containing protein